MGARGGGVIGVGRGGCRLLAVDGVEGWYSMLLSSSAVAVGFNDNGDYPQYNSPSSTPPRCVRYTAQSVVHIPRCGNCSVLRCLRTSRNPPNATREGDHLSTFAASVN